MSQHPCLPLWAPFSTVVLGLVALGHLSFEAPTLHCSRCSSRRGIRLLHAVPCDGHCSPRRSADWARAGGGRHRVDASDHARLSRGLLARGCHRRCECAADAGSQSRAGNVPAVKVNHVLYRAQRRRDSHAFRRPGRVRWRAIQKLTAGFSRHHRTHGCSQFNSSAVSCTAWTVGRPQRC